MFRKHNTKIFIVVFHAIDTRIGKLDRDALQILCAKIKIKRNMERLNYEHSLTLTLTFFRMSVNVSRR